MRHPTRRIEPVTVSSNVADVKIEWTTWQHSYINPFKGSWMQPLWWLDDQGHKRLPGFLICRRWMPHRLLMGWLCDFLDRRLT